jgi:NADPH:quinone reductase-like Zn-dependent oxidoreductase
VTEVRRLQVDGPGRVRWVTEDRGGLGEGRFRVETVHSGLSTGTDLSFVKGTNPALHRRFDTELRLFEDGDGGAATPDQPPPGYPVERFGYMQVGRVVESRTPAVAPGALVAMTYGHLTGHDADPLAERFVPLPDGLDPLLGVYVAQMGPICANGLLHAAADVDRGAVTDLGVGVRGRRVAVVGAGVVGLLCGVFARAHGAAEVAVVDQTASRLAVAEAFGLTPVDSTAADPARLLKSRWRHRPGDRGADVVFQCRGQAWALATALRLLRPQGTVVDLAFYPGGAEEVRLGEEFHHNGLALVCAQIGRVPRGLEHLWDRERLSAETVALLTAHGDAVREHLVTDVVPFEDAPQHVVDLAEGRRQTLQMVFSAPQA